MNFVIHNSFYHILLYHYLKQADYIYIGYLMKTNQYKSSYGGGDENNTKKAEQLSKSIFNKIKGLGHNEPNFVHEVNKIVNLPYFYPKVIQITEEETEYFKIIMSMSLKEVKDSYESFKLNRMASRWSSGVASNQNVFKDFLLKLNNFEVIEHLRQKFIRMNNGNQIVVDKISKKAYMV